MRRRMCREPLPTPRRPEPCSKRESRRFLSPSLRQIQQTYSAATASVQLTVNQATPTITWATPAPIAAGTALSATQLDATASVPGSFMYNPAVGAVLAAGTQQLTAVFSPTDATDYSSATAHASLIVASPDPNPPATESPQSRSPSSRPTPTGCGGPTINLNSGMSQSTLQSAITSAPSCALIIFAAGTYNITSSLTIPCSLTYHRTRSRASHSYPQWFVIGS